MRVLPCVLLLCGVIAGCAEPPPPPALVLVGDPVEGARIATRVGCNGCHGADAGGRVFHEGPEQGRIVAPNLTQRRALYPDDRALAALLHEGRTHDGHVPWGMPIKAFQHLSHAEVRDLGAWLRALPPVDNPSLPAGEWSDALAAAIADGSHPWLDDTRPDPGHRPLPLPPTEPLALGRHIALIQCSECHGWDLNGFGDEGAPPSLVVAKAYTPEQFTRLMRTGEVAAGGESATGMMSTMGRTRFHVMTDAEIDALKAYLDSR